MASNPSENVDIPADSAHSQDFLSLTDAQCRCLRRWIDRPSLIPSPPSPLGSLNSRKRAHFLYSDARAPLTNTAPVPYPSLLTQLQLPSVSHLSPVSLRVTVTNNVSAKSTVFIRPPIKHATSLSTPSYHYYYTLIILFTRRSFVFTLIWHPKITHFSLFRTCPKRQLSHPILGSSKYVVIFNNLQPQQFCTPCSLHHVKPLLTPTISALFHAHFPCQYHSWTCDRFSVHCPTSNAASSLVIELSATRPIPSVIRTSCFLVLSPLSIEYYVEWEPTEWEPKFLWAA